MTAPNGNQNNNSNNLSHHHHQDKGVCTNDVLEDLHRAIKFEAVFSTLIENKILSIKRECEEKRKQKRSFARFLFGRRNRNVASSVDDPNIEAFPAASDVVSGNGATAAGGHCIVQQENERSAAQIGLTAERRNENIRANGGGGGGGDSECFSLGNGATERVSRQPELEYKYDAISIHSDTSRPATSLCLSSTTDHHIRRQKQQNQTTLAMDSRPTSGMGSKRDRRSQSDDYIARSHQRGYLSSSTNIRMNDRLLNGAKPQQPQCNNISKSQPSSSSSSSLQSAALATESHQSQGNKSGQNNNTNSLCYTTTSASESCPLKLGPREASLLLEQERKRLRVLEMRSISAQCSPIMSRHIEFDDMANLSNSAPISLNPSVANTTTTTTVQDEPIQHPAMDATPVKTHRRPNHKSKSQRAAEYLASQIDFDSLSSYPMVNPKTQGIISSFNQLKSPNLPRVLPMKQQQQAARNGESDSQRGTAKKVDTSTTGGTITTTTSVGETTQQVVSNGGAKSKRSGRGKAKNEDNNEPRQSSELINESQLFFRTKIRRVFGNFLMISFQ